MSYKYTLKKQYARAAEQACAGFHDLEDAKFFAERKAEQDALLRTQVIYKIHDVYDEVVAEYDSQKLDHPEEEAGSQSAGSTQRFSPTPLATSPRPKGTPPKWHVDDEDKKK